MKHYRVLDAETSVDLDAKINELADQGWRLIPETFRYENFKATTWYKVHWICVMEKEATNEAEEAKLNG